MSKLKSCLPEHWLTIVTVTSIIIGVGSGFILKNWTQQPWSERQIMYLQFPGELFLRMVNCLILPLIISSIVSASCNLSKSGSIGIKALGYYSLTTTLGIILSVTLVQTIKPGQWQQNTNVTFTESSRNFVTTDTLLDLLRNLFPENLIKACLAQYRTVLKEPGNITEVSILDWGIDHEYTIGTNVLGLVFFSLVLGLALGKMEPGGKPVLDFFNTLSDVTMLIMNWVVKMAPVAVLFIIPGKILSIEDFEVMIARLGIYVLTVFIGLITHGFIILPLIYYTCTRKSPFKIISKIGPAIITAFGTSSSTATVPMTIQCLDKIGIDPKVTRFIAPIGATINMDGIALYESVGAIFIIQLRGLDFSLARIIAISITCTVSCIGAAGLPNGGYVMLVMVLNSVGVPAEDVMLIVAIDSLVDRFRTTINIIGDALAAGIIAHHTKDSRECAAFEEMGELLQSKDMELDKKELE
ncbi:excitatory amino acid transporter 3-like [Athalia rosae]|uniref:excitatory amino acid transporter 3-like n=1 Tax=Athalia rosae TaxID=37344 RepID=UPI00203350B7|nr:excitatory amino acid transporter 3-like [Athalia rosae]XP_048506349.1 excitatory amino acid transporter 3-like [Athalia rosae]XP_048506352.1 excitatory amino acid transporter 3-like [Athalia rosae]XP_048506353.1 excitatory amino acid transporter 3-like [Athalia rosae]XP_048506363.1 excitatory amino acid transporter 3-like [Athalia rosae]XP_048506372.1 excitatory amino acid transporter 3-like [Athalia rosae]